jgi:aspartyl-tRNA(Asn)/glutamyl-tRNA(Gln) amidotransferase subunit A
MLCPTLDHCGPMARSVAECALQLEVMAGESPRDPRTTPVPVERWTEVVARGVEGLTVGVAERYFFEHSSPDIAASARRGIDALRDAGARIVEVDMQWPTKRGIADPFTPEEAATIWEFWPERRAELGRDVQRDLAAAEPMLAVDSAITSRTGRVPRPDARGAGLGRVDLVATPAQAFTPPHIGVIEVPFAGDEAFDVTFAMCGLTQIFNILGWPAISVPSGRDDANMPVGLQLASLPWQESYCLAAAAVVEAASI